MKKFFAQAVLAVPMWIALGGVGFAMCVWFAPPSKQFNPATNIQTLFVRDSEQMLNMIVQPQFSGDATEFGLIMPFPSQPSLFEPVEELFDELEDLTNPNIVSDFGGRGFALESAADDSVSASVEVLEQRVVGDFEASVLKANDAGALNEWLDENGFESTAQKQDTLAEYLKESGFFVALKVDYGSDTIDEDGFLSGELAPIGFTFESESTSLPLRLMNGETSIVSLTVYSIADELTYLPGTELQYSKKVSPATLKTSPSIEQFDPNGKWLTRSFFQFDPAETTQDASLTTTTDTVVVVPGEIPLILNPDQLPLETGILESAGEPFYTEEVDVNVEPSEVEESSDQLTGLRVLVGILVLTNAATLVVLMRRHS